MLTCVSDSPIAANNTLPQRRDLPARAAGQEMLVRETEGGQVHFLNATAALVWECCDGRTTAGECVARLRAAFAVPAEVDLDADVREVVADLAKRGLFVGRPSGG